MDYGSKYKHSFYSFTVVDEFSKPETKGNHDGETQFFTACNCN
jgi:hypothetical protein